MVANGHHWDARWPEPPYPGQGSFAGEQIHVHNYREPDVLLGKRVLVLGIGNSATDLAVESSRTADATFLAMRRGAWIIPKYIRGRPTDELATDLVTRLPLRGAAGLLQAHAEDGGGLPDRLRPARAGPQARRGASHDLVRPPAPARPRRHHGEAEHRRVRRRTHRALRGRHQRGARPDRLLHRLQDHVPVLRSRAAGRPRQPDPAVSPGRPPGASGPLLHRPGAAAGRDHADRGGAVRVDRRRPRGQGRAAGSARACAA